VIVLDLQLPWNVLCTAQVHRLNAVGTSHTYFLELVFISIVSLFRLIIALVVGDGLRINHRSARTSQKKRD
jgi:hypothetical protein